MDLINVGQARISVLGCRREAADFQSGCSWVGLLKVGP
jgi:hypothetical protein